VLDLIPEREGPTKHRESIGNGVTAKDSLSKENVELNSQMR